LLNRIKSAIQGTARTLALLSTSALPFFVTKNHFFTDKSLRHCPPFLFFRIDGKCPFGSWKVKLSLRKASRHQQNGLIDGLIDTFLAFSTRISLSQLFQYVSSASLRFFLLYRNAIDIFAFHFFLSLRFFVLKSKESRQE